MRTHRGGRRGCTQSSWHESTVAWGPYKTNLGRLVLIRCHRTCFHPIPPYSAPYCTLFLACRPLAHSSKMPPVLSKCHSLRPISEPFAPVHLLIIAIPYPPKVPFGLEMSLQGYPVNYVLTENSAFCSRHVAIPIEFYLSESLPSSSALGFLGNQSPDVPGCFWSFVSCILPDLLSLRCSPLSVHRL